MTLLVTGFEPFGGQKVNPSAIAAEGLPDRIGEHAIKKALIPVSWNKAGSALHFAVKQYQPDRLLLLGQAGGSEEIRIERIAVNISGGTDNEGTERAEGTPVIKGAPAAYFSTIEYVPILSGLLKEKIPARYAYHAGIYLCNCLLFTALHTYPSVPAGFIHLPLLESQTGTPPYITGMTLKKAMLIAVKAIFQPF